MKKGKKKPQQKKQKPKFLGMSKLIGFVIFGLSVLILVFTMYEMHVTQDLSSLSHLIIGVFGLAASYVGFYITMAKAEHLEDKKNEIRKELEKLRIDGIQEDEREKYIELRNRLEQLGQNLDELETEEETETNYFNY